MLRLRRTFDAVLIILVAAFCAGSTNIGFAAESTYSFHEAANVLLRNFFPNNAFPDDARFARLVVEQMPPPISVEDFFHKRTRFFKPLELERDMSEFSFSGDIIDSPFVDISRRNGHSPQSLLRSPFYENNLGAVQKLLGAELQFDSVREKALFQRDLFHIMHVMYRVFIHVNESEDVAKAQKLLDEMCTLFPKTFLTESELTAIHTRDLDPSNYSLKNAWSSEDNYLPGFLFRHDSDFAEIPILADQTVHFVKHGGRSFFRVYINAPGWDEEKTVEFWREISSRHGKKANVTRGLERLPAGTETVLTRSFGLFLVDGSYVDSGVLEEVLLRNFKYKQRTLDLDSTDYWGTNYSEFVLNRTRFLENEDDIALERTANDSITYTGIVGEAYERSGFTYNTITTMKWNCYSCHSLVGYGTRTVLSLRIRETRDIERVQRFEEYLRIDLSNAGRFELVSPLVSYARSHGHFNTYTVD